MPPTLPPLLNPDPGLDVIGILITVVVPILMGMLATSSRAREMTQTLLNLYNLYRGFRDRNRPKPAPAPAPTNSNGNGHSNGGASDLLKSVMQNLRVEADARESGDLSIAQRLDNLSERGRRDSDNFYMLYSELSRDSKKHSEDIALLKAERVRMEVQMLAMFSDQTQKLETILHLLQPPQPTPPGHVIDLDDSDDLEAVG